MLTLEQVSTSYPSPQGRIPVLRNLDLRADPGDLVVVQGPSGSGKSTLLFTAAAMLPPDAGHVCCAGVSLYDLSRAARNRFRAASVGFIFQRFHLIPYLSVEDNLLWPLRWNPGARDHYRRVPELCRRLGLQHRLDHLPAQLSAGEQQRTAVARALLGDKRLICADEPTGNLDEENAALVIDVLKAEAARGCIVLLVTHQRELASLGRACVTLAAPHDSAENKANRNPPGLAATPA